MYTKTYVCFTSLKRFPRIARELTQLLWAILFVIGQTTRKRQGKNKNKNKITQSLEQCNWACIFNREKKIKTKNACTQIEKERKSWVWNRKSTRHDIHQKMLCMFLPFKYLRIKLFNPCQCTFVCARLRFNSCH